MGRYAFRAYRRKKSIWSKLLMVLAFIIILAVAVLIYVDVKIGPIVEQMGKSRAKSIATLAINEAVTNALAKDDIKYDDLISFDKSTDGHITALKTNIAKMNYIKSNLSVAILNALTKYSETEISIPLGNIINGEILSGRGPKIKIKLVPVGYVTTDIENIFASAGINQTRHQILLNVSATVAIIMPNSKSIASDVATSICIAETVIVGAVPDTFTNVEGAFTDETTDKIWDILSNVN